MKALKNFLNLKITCAAAAFSAQAIAVAGDLGSSSDKSWTLTAKPSAIFGATGGGVEFGREWTDSGVALLNVELDHFLVGGTAFLGASWRQFLWYGTFVQGGLGVSGSFFYYSSSRTPASFATVGWEYQGNETFRPGIDAIGYHQSLGGEPVIDGMFGFPKVRLTFRF